MAWLYTGSGRRAYHDYLDEATGRMLEAKPGGTYEIRATWDKLPVPPADGHWQAADPEASEDASLSQDADTSGVGQRGTGGGSKRRNRSGGGE